MQKIYETRTEREAVELAVREFGVNEEFLEVEVLEKSKNKLFNRNGKITVRVSVHGLPDAEERIHDDNNIEEKRIYQEDEQKEEASAEHQEQICQIVQELIVYIGVEVSATFSLEDNFYIVTLHTNVESDQNLLIGKHGKNIEAIQNICNSIIQNKLPEFSNYIVIDVENYRKKRTEWLSSIARKKSSQVLQTGKPYLMDSLGPFDRKLIHRVIKDIDGVNTISKGNGYHKRVQIYLED